MSGLTVATTAWSPLAESAHRGFGGTLPSRSPRSWRRSAPGLRFQLTCGTASVTAGATESVGCGGKELRPEEPLELELTTRQHEHGLPQRTSSSTRRARPFVRVI